MPQPATPGQYTESKRDATYTAYLIHFDAPYKHARHYIGITYGDVNERIAAHHRGEGCNLIRVVMAAGISWRLARVWENVPRFFEMKLKARGGARRLCPICRGEHVPGNGVLFSPLTTSAGVQP